MHIESEREIKEKEEHRGRRGAQRTRRKTQKRAGWKPALPGSGVRLEVDFVLDGGFVPAGAQEDASSVFDHAGVATQVGGGVFGAEIPEFEVFADEVVGAAEFTMPIGIFPGAADGGDIGEPGGFGGDPFEFLAIAEFMGKAGTVNTEEAMLAGHGRAALLPVLIYSADVADVGGDAGDGAKRRRSRGAAS